MLHVSKQVVQQLRAYRHHGLSSFTAVAASLLSSYWDVSAHLHCAACATQGLCVPPALSVGGKSPCPGTQTPRVRGEGSASKGWERGSPVHAHEPPLVGPQCRLHFTPPPPPLVCVMPT